MLKAQDDITVCGRAFLMEAPIILSGSVQSWQARDKQTQRRCFLKCASLDDAPSVAMLGNEARILAELHHPAFPRLLSHGSSPSHSFLIIEWLEGLSLSEKLKRARLTLSEIQEIGLSLWDTLEALHSYGIVHGDVKPDHLILSGTTVRLCDFGFSHHADDLPQLGATIAYASPEQLGLLRRPVTPSTDLYSAGLILLECLTGGAVWSDNDDLSNRLALPISLAERRDGPRSLHLLLRHLLQPDNRARYATAQSAKDDWRNTWAEPEIIHPLGMTDIRRSLTTPAAVGRGDELAVLLEYLTSDESSPLWLGGRSGRGKSRLLHLLADLARSQGRIALWGRGLTTRRASFDVWHELAAGLVQTVHADVLIASTHRSMRMKAAVLFRAFPVLGFNQTGESGHAGTDTLCEALLQLIRLLPHQIVFCLDDVQWADPLTLAFLQSELPANLKVVAAYRDDEFSRDRFPGRDLNLLPLDDQAARQMLLTMAGPLPPEGVEAIVHRAKGEPFLLSALLLGAREMGALVEDAEGWSWSSGGQVQAGLRAGVVLSERLAICSESELSFLRVAAVLGQEFSLTQAGAIAGLPDDLTHEALNNASERHLLWRIDNDRVIFSHDKVREGLLEELDSEALSTMHRGAAEWLETETEVDLEKIAYHWVQAGALDRAFPFAWRAAERAFERLNYPSAVEYYLVAKDAWPEELPLEFRFRICDGLAQALDYSTYYDDAIPTYHQALECAKTPQDRLMTLGRMCFAYTRAMRVSETAPLVAEGLQLLAEPMPGSKVQAGKEALVAFLKLAYRLFKNDIPQSSDTDLSFQARVRLRLATLETAVYAGDRGTMLWSLLRGCEEISRASAPTDGSLIWANAGTLVTMLRVPSLSSRLFSLAFAAAGENLRYLGQVTAQSGFLPVLDGDPVKAAEVFARGSKMSESQGDRWNWDTSLSYWSLMECTLGNFQEGARYSLEVFQRQTIQETNFFASLLILAKCGQARTHEAILQEAIDQGLDVMRLEFLAKFALGLVKLQKGSVTEALPFLDRANALVTPELFFWGTSAPAWLATAWRVLAESLPAEGLALRRKLLRQARSAVTDGLKHTKHWIITQPHALREAAISAALEGRFRRARSQFEKSLELSEKMSMAFETAWTLYERGRFARVAGWTDWEDDQAEGRFRARRLGGWIPGVDLGAPEPERHLARLDRFDRVLESGRRLVQLSGEPQVMEALTAEAKALLRCDRVVFVPKNGETPEGWSTTLHQRCLTEGRAVTEAEVEESSRSLLLHEARSTLMAPLRVEEQHIGVLVAWQKTIGGFFGEEEVRLADYLCTLGGAGLENARILAERDSTFAALETSEQRFRGFFDYAGVGTALLDEQGRATEENPYLGQLLGHSTKGKSPWEYCHAADRDDLKSGFATLAKGTIARHDAEVRLHRAGGEVAWTQVCLVKLPVSVGDQPRFLMTIADTTHRRIAEMMTFLENERRGLAAEVHDELAQNLGALHLILAQVQTNDPKLQSAKDLAKQLVTDASTLISSLRNPLAEGIDLVSALKTLITRFSIDTDIQIEVTWPPQPIHLSDLCSLVAYRVIQESLTNVRKHSEARQVALVLNPTADRFHISIRDNGKGFDPTHHLERPGATEHFGLLSMRDRVQMVGGQISVISAPGDGTDIRISLPLQYS